MKKILIGLFIGVLIVTMSFIGIGCKTGATTTAAAETTAAAGGMDFSGTTVDALILGGEDCEYIISTLAPRLLKETGINLVVNQIPYESERAAQLSDANGAKKYDIINPCTEWSFEYSGFAASLDDYIGKEGYPDIEEEDLIQFVYKAFNPTGVIQFIPYQPDTRLFFYRKDLLEAQGIAVPKTWDELLAAAAKLTKDGKYGFVYPATRGWNLTLAWVPLLFSAGGDLFDGRTPVFNSQAGVDAINLLIELKKYGPPDIDTYGEKENNNAFINDLAAMGISASGITSLINAPDSPVKDMWAAAAFPVQEAGFVPKNTSGMGGWAFGVSEYSKAKDAAAYTVLWLTSKAIVTEMQINGRTHASRESQRTSAELLAKNPFVPAIIDALSKSKIFFEGPEGAAIGELVNVRVAQAISGEMDPKEALDLAAEEAAAALK